MSTTNQKKAGFRSIYRVSDAQPNWAQTDPSQPDYIKNKEDAQEVRPIKVNGEEFLSNEIQSGELNFAAGRNIVLTAKDNTIVISSVGGGGEGGGGVAYIEGEGIDIVENEYGQFVITLEENAIVDKFVNSISFDKIAQKQDEVLILNGGKANGNY